MIAMNCGKISSVQKMIEAAADKNTLDHNKLLALHNAYLNRGELQQKIDQLHVEFKHLESVYRQQQFAADLNSESITHAD